MARRAPPRRSSESGAALLVAIVSIAILTALALDLAYETQVRLRIAANARDDLRAGAMAQSAVNLSRLVLSFQAQLDQSLSAACGLTSVAAQASAGGKAGATATAAAASACPRPQLWSLVPVSNGLTHALFGSGAAAATAAQGTGQAPAATEGAPVLPSAAYGDFEGGFQAKIEDEGQKINAQLDALQGSGTTGAQVEALLGLACDSKWDPLFDRTDADGQRYSRTDLVTNLRDWVDENNTTSVLTASFPGGNCSPLVPAFPFEEGFGDENYPYDRGPDRYKAKNARMDSLDELYLVAGVTDAWMAAFGDRLTVYLPNGASLNVNTDDPAQQLRIAALLADPTSRTLLLDPAFAQAFRKALSLQTMGGFLSIAPATFIQTLQALGVKIRTEYQTQANLKAFTDRSVVYRIRALGVAGDVTHETEAVVSFDPRQTATTDRPALGAATASQPPMGRLVHWHEE
jgi:general secretion pathway protein K